MPKTTTNYGLKKPLYSENADVGVLNEGLDKLDAALTPSVSSASAPASSSSKGKLETVLGKSSWQAAPDVTLEECSNHIQSGTHRTATTSLNGFMSSSDKSKLDNATSSYTASRLMLRDSYGRAQVQSPSSSYDIANKTYVDSNFVRKNAATTMTAKLTAQSNTSYTTKQVRNIVFWTSGTTPPATSYGDVVIKTF